MVSGLRTRIGATVAVSFRESRLEKGAGFGMKYPGEKGFLNDSVKSVKERHCGEEIPQCLFRKT